jgi:hypothetical protein
MVHKGRSYYPIVNGCYYRAICNGEPSHHIQFGGNCATFWRFVTCEECLKHKPKSKLSDAKEEG